MSKCEIIAIANQKGGVAKTTTTINLGYSLAEQGKKVLLVDCDSQANLTMSFGKDPDEITIALYDLMFAISERKELPQKSEYVIPCGKLDLLPSDIKLAKADLRLSGATRREYILKTLLNGLREDYDYIIMDCMPSLGLVILNALTACDSVIIPTEAEYFSAKGLDLLLDTISAVKSELNPKLIISGILVTMFSGRTKLSKNVYDYMKDSYGGDIRVFTNTIPVSVKVGEASALAKSIIEYDPKGKVSQAYLNFVKEYLNE